MKRHTSCRIHEMFFQYHYLNQFEESYSPHFLQKNTCFNALQNYKIKYVMLKTAEELFHRTFLRCFCFWEKVIWQELHS